MISKFRRNEEGATAVEFSLVALPFFMMLIAIGELGLKTLLQAELDDVMFSTAIHLSQESDAGIDKEEFRQTVICDTVSPILIDCDDIVFGVEAMPNRWGEHLSGRHTETFIDRWNTGCANSTLIIEFLYPMPNILLPFGIVEQVVHEEEDFMRSRGIIRREPLVVGSGTAEGGVPC